MKGKKLTDVIMMKRTSVSPLHKYSCWLAHSVLVGGFRNICVGKSQLLTDGDQLQITEQGRKEMFYLTTHSTHFIYGYMASDIL